ncbi:MAG: NYN domain-containing protein [Candidatus Berkelbacteria bacterium]|nr:MAG: NYN domain-containing protein [Candidatus Berkelbacteria bacterium]QQG51402.1 MAG: NYN domain-containing protein [Candidatus Berkelbacteria bacterium]
MLGLTPPTSYANQRVGVFIDIQNMYYSARAMYDSHVNFGKILEHAVNKRQLIRAIAYVVRSDAPKEQTFFDALEKVGLEIRSKDIQIFPGGEKKGDWDVGVAVDAIKIADRLDVVVLVTGDGDFLPLVTYLKENKGCRVEGIAFGRSTSSRLIEALDHFYDLDANAKDYLIKTKH